LAGATATESVAGRPPADDRRRHHGGAQGARRPVRHLRHQAVDRPPRLYGPLPEIEDQWPQGPPREQLWWFFRVAHRDNNQVLHSTALGLSGGVSRTTDSLGLDAGPSDRDLDRGSAPCGATSRCSPCSGTTSRSPAATRWTRSPGTPATPSRLGSLAERSRTPGPKRRARYAEPFP
jgi:hypothetical protein